MTDENRKIAFICSKGALDMAYPALIMGWAALGNGIDVTIFFTFWGMDLITEKRIDHLEIAPVANTSMKMGMMGVPGNLGIPNLMGVLPGMLVDGGAKLYGCKMSVDMMGLKKEDFIDGVIDVVTAADFIDMSEGAQIIFI
jgi:peroxiredoxin family protein